MECHPPEKECDACKEIKSLINEISKREKAWNIRKVLPLGNQCSINLSSKHFRNFWVEWWGEKKIPQLDIDILIVLDEPVIIKSLYRDLRRPTLLGIEVKYFRKQSKMSFYEGLDQTLAYLRIGLDKAALLHLFHPAYPEEQAKIRARTTEVLVEGIKLPIAYVACKLMGNGRFRVYTKYSKPQDVTIREVLHFLKQAPFNSLYSNISYAGEVVRIRQTLMALLQIPSITRFYCLQ